MGFNINVCTGLNMQNDTGLIFPQERSKALGYIQTNIRATDQALEAMDEQAAQRPADNMNHLHVKLLRCAGLVPRREGTVGLRLSICLIYFSLCSI